ncbi:hypothetical protein DM02DRAFT_638649 [Periconia macrospinosa]|uniref:Uncharacterized protein n=1 Tax=Periconia macrospinosa TaxID=97972 RepID=A0A2V1E7W7_9PLEO|nr:hypothetical protein DM02DRAFT_638649 [Periconia macrospinosa]
MPIPTLASSLKLRSLRRAGREPTNSNSATYNAGDEQKRRSFLPQRGLPKVTSRSDAITETPSAKLQSRDTPTNAKEPSNERMPAPPQQHVNTSGVQTSRSRPQSLYQPRTINQDAIVERDEANASHLGNRNSKPLPSARLQRSASLRHPEASNQTTQSTNNRSHIRTRSTATALSKGSREVAPYKERPRSLVVAPSHSTTATAPRASARLESLNRSSSTRAKPEQARGPTAATTEPASSDASHSQAKRREATKEEPRKLARPAFSTLQQHFTPRKTGKAATSTFLNPPPDISVTHLPPEIMILQSELLQLHLLHATSAQIGKQWELSAEQTLRAKFDEVASLYQVMREYERHGVEQKNLQALRDWNQATMSSGLVKHLQVLSGPLNEVPTLLDAGGRYDELVRHFEQWMAQVEEIRLLRNSSIAGGLSEIGSIEGLGDWWKEENQVLTRKLTSFLRDLDGLQMPAPGSSIAYIVTICKQLLDGLVSELQIMQAINSDVVAREEQWIEDRLQMIAQDIGVMLGSSEDNEAWRF